MADKQMLTENIIKQLSDYGPNLVEGVEEVIGELRGERLSDTDELFALVIQGINWEIEVFNNCEDTIVGVSDAIDKGRMAAAVGRLGKVLAEKDDIKIAACLEVDFLPFVRSMNEISRKLLAA